MVAGDFLGDGHAAIYAVQNSYAPIPSTGRSDGGLSQLLRGDGRGHFTAVPPDESNLVVPGDAKALVVIDSGGAPGFLVSRNNGSTLAFSRVASGRTWLRVSLAGGPGNPTAVGAQVTVVFADGGQASSEVHAGSGLYSQSTPTLYFGYSGDRPPVTARVRWPGGKLSSQALPPHPGSLVIAAPAP
jgi:hypothetical protein